MQGNILGQNNIYNNSGEGNANLMFPIYQQTTEPKEKYGIWIKSNENIEDVYFQTDDVREYIEVNELPFSFSGRATSIGSDIYLLGGGDDDKSAYKYNSIEGTYTKLANIPLTYEYCVTATTSNETEIYIASGENYNGTDTRLHKYNPAENTYSSLSTLYYIAGKGSSLTILEDNLYMFGSENNEDAQQAYKYNLNGGGFTKLEDIPKAFNGRKCYSN